MDHIKSTDPNTSDLAEFDSHSSENDRELDQSNLEEEEEEEKLVLVSSFSKAPHPEAEQESDVKNEVQNIQETNLPVDISSKKEQYPSKEIENSTEQLLSITDKLEAMNLEDKPNTSGLEESMIESEEASFQMQETGQFEDDSFHETKPKGDKEGSESGLEEDKSFQEGDLDVNHSPIQTTQVTTESSTTPKEVVKEEIEKTPAHQVLEQANLVPELKIDSAPDIETKAEEEALSPHFENPDTVKSSNTSQPEKVVASVETAQEVTHPNETEMENTEVSSVDIDVVEEPVCTKESQKAETVVKVNPSEFVETASPSPPTQLPVSSSSPSARTEITPPGDMLHHIKNIQFKDKKIGIVTQNENGPCPLVAILNVLLLRRQITLPAHSEIVSAAKLMEYIGDAMLESVPKNLSGEVRLNYEQNMHDAMAVLPKLQTGLDVNVKFTGVRDFEYTPECIIFDLLRIPLFHGWLVDPQTPEVVAAVGQAGYNQLVEKVISQKCSNDEDAVMEALVIENFLERSASQLTYHGLSELTTSMDDDEIGVLFRNNHFSTIYKHQKELLQLVTDQGFLGESNVIWETLGSIDGDGQFVDSHFRTVPPKPEHAPSGSSASPNTSAQLTAEQQIDHDFLVALSLQEEQQQEQPAAHQDEVISDVGEDVAKTLAEDEKTTQELMDLELARQLQQEEERQAAEAETAEREARSASPQQQASGSRSPPQPTKKKDNCTFL